MHSAAHSIGADARRERLPGHSFLLIVLLYSYSALAGWSTYLCLKTSASSAFSKPTATQRDAAIFESAQMTKISASGNSLPQSFARSWNASSVLKEKVNSAFSRSSWACVGCRLFASLAFWIGFGK